MDLTVQYGGFSAVGSVSLTVPDRGIYGLAAPAGAGQTSLFNGGCGQEAYLGVTDEQRSAPAKLANDEAVPP
jgi:ABC-type branched-subunit amino acid transport system ATPase component